MDSAYRLKNNKVFELAEFPHVNPGEKVVILFTGGIKSTLVALIAKKIYGIDNVIFGHISVHAFGDFFNDPERVALNKKNYDDAVQRLGGVHKFVLDNRDYSTNKNMHELHQKKILAMFPSLKYTIAGWNKPYEESMEMLQDSGYGKGMITKYQLTKFVKDNAEKYPTLNFEIENWSQPIPFTNRHLDHSISTRTFNHTVRPLRHLDDSEVIELYTKMNLLSELRNTKSCEKNANQHCGNCRNCLKRKYAFSDAGISDQTEYRLN
jgi:7-cyano-7-deazaguanine synthase